MLAKTAYSRNQGFSAHSRLMVPETRVLSEECDARYQPGAMKQAQLSRLALGVLLSASFGCGSTDDNKDVGGSRTDGSTSIDSGGNRDATAGQDASPDGGGIPDVQVGGDAETGDAGFVATCTVAAVVDLNSAGTSSTTGTVYSGDSTAAPAM